MRSIKACDHEPTQVLDIDGVAYFGSDEYGVRDFEGDLVVNFTKTPNRPGGNFRDIDEYIKLGFGHELMVPWPDFGLPRIKDGFWSALHESIKRRGWTRVCFHCAMGHGRTGTALSAMLIEVAGFNVADAVQTVRDIHCEEAVESSGQMNYLLSISAQEEDPENLPIPSMNKKVSKYNKPFWS